MGMGKNYIKKWFILSDRQSYKIRAWQKKKEEKLWQNKINKNKIQKLSTATTNVKIRNELWSLSDLWSSSVWWSWSWSLSLATLFLVACKKKMLCVLGSKRMFISHRTHPHIYYTQKNISSKLHLYNPQTLCAEWVSAATTTIGWFGLVGCFVNTHTHIWFGLIYLCDWPPISTLPSAASSSFYYPTKTHTHTKRI